MVKSYNFQIYESDNVEVTMVTVRHIALDKGMLCILFVIEKVCSYYGRHVICLSFFFFFPVERWFNITEVLANTSYVPNPLSHYVALPGYFH